MPALRVGSKCSHTGPGVCCAFSPPCALLWTLIHTFVMDFRFITTIGRVNPPYVFNSAYQWARNGNPLELAHAAMWGAREL
jgi:hypothetical protein